MTRPATRNWGFLANHADGARIERYVFATTRSTAEAEAKAYCERNGWDPQLTEIEYVYPLSGETA